MIITNIGIHNFRSIKDVSFEVKEFMVFLGPNNHGKSNILNAIEFALSTSAKVTEEDFFCFIGDDENEVHSDELWVELTFSQLTTQEQVTFSKYVRKNGTLKIRKFALLDEDGNVENGYRGYLEEPEKWWLRSEAYERLNTLSNIQNEAKDIPELLGLSEGGGRITKQRLEEFQYGYIEAHRDELVFHEKLEETPFLGTKNVGGGVLPDFYLVPAVRDVGDEMRIKPSTLFGKLIQRSLVEMTERDERFIAVRERLISLISELNERPDVSDEEKSDIALLESRIADELRTWSVDVSIKVEPPEVEKIFEMGTQIWLNDGLETLAERKGHGLQRAVIFALIRAWARTLRLEREKDEEEMDQVARKSSDSVVFAIEEPELFLHPHAQRQLASDLFEIACAENYQVLVCSHSTHFVDLDIYQSVAVVSKNDNRKGTLIKQCTEDLFAGEDDRDKKARFHMAYWVNPDRGEMFFSRRVALVEGETEKALLPYLAKKLDIFDPSVSVIDCGSKHNLPLYITILNAFSHPYCVVHDEDPLPDPIPKEWNENKIREKRRTFELNATIADMIDYQIGDVSVISPDCEGASGISRSQGKKMGKAIAALEYYAETKTEDIPQPIKDMVFAVYKES
jgi:putative ATP-dependent endonuclease of OLD family